MNTKPSKRPIIAIGGAIAQRPNRGGHAWVFLQYLLGFRQLGWDTMFIDWVSPGMCTDSKGLTCPPERSVNVSYLAAVMDASGLSDSYALFDESGDHIAGVGRQETLCRLRRSDALINVMGYVRDEQLLAAAPLRVFLDIDPGFGQMWNALGLHDPFVGHDAFVSVGQNIGSEGCLVPTCDLRWVNTHPPVVLDLWPRRPSDPRAPFTSVASWRGPNAPIEFEGHTYGLRAHEFRKFASLPERCTSEFEVALDIDSTDGDDAQRLRAHGWRLSDPFVRAGTPVSYQEFIASSLAEFMVAKAMYVDARTGWFSDRSACYLATGRPVVAQDTGLADHLPTDCGLLTFTTVEEASEAAAEVAADLERHSAAARALAEDVFDARKVLALLLQGIGVV